MKKIILSTFVCLLLTSCGTPESPKTNSNAPLSDMPLFLSQNGNINAMLANQNMNSTDGTNTNANTTNSNDNLNAPQNGNSNGTTENANLNTNSTVVPPVVTTNPNMLIPHEIAFDCKPLSIYETMPFYSDFISQFEKLPRYSSTDLKLMIARSSTEDSKQTAINKAMSAKESKDNITSSCLAKDESLFLIVVEGEKEGYGFKIVRYQPARKYIELAQREDERFGTLWNATPLFFGKRTGNTLQMSASTTTTTKTEWYTFGFNYVTNTMSLDAYCSKTAKGKKECGKYSYK